MHVRVPYVRARWMYNIRRCVEAAYLSHSEPALAARFGLAWVPDEQHLHGHPTSTLNIGSGGRAAFKPLGPRRTSFQNVGTSSDFGCRIRDRILVLEPGCCIEGKISLSLELELELHDERVPDCRQEIAGCF